MIQFLNGVVEGSMGAKKRYRILYQKCTDPVYPDTPWTPDAHCRGPALCPLSCSSSYSKGSPLALGLYLSTLPPCALSQLPERGCDQSALSPGSLRHPLLPCSIGARPFSEKPLSSVPGQGGFQGRAQEDRPHYAQPSLISYQTCSPGRMLRGAEGHGPCPQPRVRWGQ